ncbi:MAG: hypothetical protein M3O82_02960 [Verrucomicrobiota bacterium]|nr:hypothetical protein [Verrucomicrobiota bacterium]
MRKTSVAVAAVFLLVTGVLVASFIVAGFAVVDRRHVEDFAFLQRRVALLQSENERLENALREKRKTDGAAFNIRARAEIEQSVSATRQLRFLQPVDYAVLSHERIKQTILEKLDEQFSETDFKNLVTGLAALGFIEPNYPLKQKYIDLLGEQVAAFYDQHQHKLFMFEDASLDNQQNRAILAHELTHALQDQNFGLGKLPLEIKNDDDRAFAASALIEGDATLVMSQFVLQNASLRGLGENVSQLVSQNMDEIAKAPRYLREMLLFPYLRGQEFCAVIQSRAGYDGLSKVYEHPPASSTQILHPEKYFAHEEPIWIDWPDTKALGQDPVADNVVGEMGARILFTDCVDADTAQRAASGWRGDRYLVFGDGEALVWKTLWNSEREAREFMRVAQQYLEARQRAKKLLVKLEMTHPNEVVLIRASTNEWVDALSAKFAR